MRGCNGQRWVVVCVIRSDGGSNEWKGAARGLRRDADTPREGGMMSFLPSFTHERNPKNAGSAASRGLTRVMDGSGHRDGHDACPGSSVHICRVGERIGMSSGVAHAARHPRSSEPDPRLKTPTVKWKTRAERRAVRCAQGLARRERVGMIRRVGDRTRSRRIRASRDGPRGAPPRSTSTGRALIKR